MKALPLVRTLIALGILGGPTLVAQGPPPLPAPAAGPQLTIRAWLDKDAIRPHDIVRLWLALDNRDTREVGEIAFDEFQTPGFSRAGCWVGATPACAAGNSVTPALPRLTPGQSVIVSALLIRNDDELRDGGKVFLTGTLRWQAFPAARRGQPPPAPVTLTGIVSAGPVELSPTRWYATPQALGLRELGKDLVLPLLLLVGGYVFQRFQHARTERQVIWTQMLGKVTRDVERHLLPIASATDAVITRAESVQAAADQAAAWQKEERRVTYAVLMLNRQVVLLVDTVGGFYFGLRSAETVASVCWEGFRKRQSESPVVNEALTRAVSTIKPTMSYGAFVSRLAASEALDAQFRTDVATVSAEVESWVSGDGLHELKYLEILLRVLEAEIDRPFERWYGIPPHVNRPHLNRARRRWGNAAAGTQDRIVADALRRYIRETGIAWQMGLSRPWGLWLTFTRWIGDRWPPVPPRGRV